MILPLPHFLSFPMWIGQLSGAGTNLIIPTPVSVENWWEWFDSLRINNPQRNIIIADKNVYNTVDDWQRFVEQFLNMLDGD